MIKNRESFLQNIASQLGRTAPLSEKPARNWQYSPQHKTLTHQSIDELLNIFIKQCENIHTKVAQCSQASLQQTLQLIIDEYGGGSIITSDDERFEQLGLTSTLQDAHRWQPALGEENIRVAEAAKIGIVVSDITLAESGTIILQSEAKKGRSISFLPENSIAIVPKSSLVPRMTQAAKILRAQGATASCINFITGPSNSADIEMILVVGVHGPVRMTYIIVEDF